MNGRRIYFVGNVPSATTRRQLAGEVQRALRPRLGWLSPRYPKVLRVEFLQVSRAVDGPEERHGLVWVASRGLFSTAADPLRRVWVAGRLLKVHPFVKRTPYKDRRKLGFDGRDLSMDRRRADRRRYNVCLEIEQAPYADGVYLGQRLARQTY